MTTTSPFPGALNPSTRNAGASAPTTGRPGARQQWVTSGGQWGGIAAGAFTGLAVAVLMATLGAALGLTATAAAAEHASRNGMSTAGAAEAAIGLGLGAGVWLILTAAVVGIAAGLVLAKTSHAERPYSPNVHGLVTWACGITVAAVFAASGANSLASLAGAAAAHAPIAAIGTVDGMAPKATDARATETKPAEAALERNPMLLTPERAAAMDAAKAAAAAVVTAAWVALLAQCVGLAATLWAARRRPLQVTTHVDLQTA